MIFSLCRYVIIIVLLCHFVDTVNQVLESRGENCEVSANVLPC